MKQGTLSRIVTAFAIALLIALILAIMSVEETLGQQIYMSARNEFTGISNNTAPASNLPQTNSSQSDDSRETSNIANPQTPVADFPVLYIPEELTPAAQTPAGPFDPGEQPQTDDGAEIRPLLIGLALGAYLLKNTVFKKKEEEMRR